MKDVMLISLAVMAEHDPPIEQDVTLLVGGFLVSGFVVSYEKFAQHHQTSAGIDSAKRIILAENAAPEDKTYNFLHLRDAKYYLPGVQPIPGNTGVFVRIPIESVNGFSFGKLEVA